MDKKLKYNQLKSLVKSNFPVASKSGIESLTKILDQCCCDFDPCKLINLIQDIQNRLSILENTISTLP